MLDYLKQILPAYDKSNDDEFTVDRFGTQKLKDNGDGICTKFYTKGQLKQVFELHLDWVKSVRTKIDDWGKAIFREVFN